MYSYKNILVAIDLGFCSDKLIKRAVFIAKQQGAFLTICHVGSPKISGNAESANFLYDNMQNNLVRMTNEDTYSKYRALCEQLKFENYRIVHRVGANIAKTIVDEIAVEFKIDLLICASSNRRGLDSLIVGSTASEIVKRAPMDMYLVKKCQVKYED